MHEETSQKETAKATESRLGVSTSDERNKLLFDNDLAENMVVASIW